MSKTHLFGRSAAEKILATYLCPLYSAAGAAAKEEMLAMFLSPGPAGAPPAPGDPPAGGRSCRARCDVCVLRCMGRRTLSLPTAA